MKNGNGKFEIDKSIKIPPSRRDGKYPFAELDVGESFFGSAKQTSIEGLRNACCYHGRMLKRKFSCRSVEENGERGLRVWRVK